MLTLKGPWTEFIKAVGIKTKTAAERLYIFSIYIAPTKKVTVQHWSDLLEHIPTYAKMIIMGDLNAHIPHFSPYDINLSGKVLMEVLEDRNLIIMNDGQPTYGEMMDYGSILDLTLVSPQISNISEGWTTDEAFGSDHLPVLLSIQLRISDICDCLNRLRLHKVDSILFGDLFKEYVENVTYP